MITRIELNLGWPPGVCAARVPDCRTDNGKKMQATQEDCQRVNRLMPRLRVTGLARLLGTTIKTLDNWVCSFRGVRPDQAAAFQEAVLRWVRHQEDNPGCGCKLCAPTTEQRLFAKCALSAPPTSCSPAILRCFARNLGRPAWRYGFGGRVAPCP